MGESLKKGTLIRHFSIIGKIDSGGMANVYKAFDKKLRRVVAIKTIREDKVEEETIKRFVSEARSLAQLNHTNITAVYDIDKIGGNYYLAMEYVEGNNLKEHIKENEMTFGELLQMSQDLADAFKYIHGKGIIHRDIKPTNVICSKDKIFKVIDFGISKWDDDPNSHKTKTNFFVGSLRYLAPEVFFNANSTIQSDVYGLGMTILYVLLGRPYINGKSSEDIIKNVAEDKGELPRIINDNLPEEFKDFIFYLTQKDPADRCQTMKEALRILQALIPQISDALKAKSLSELRMGEVNHEETIISRQSLRIPKPRSQTQNHEVVEESFGGLSILDELKIPNIPSSKINDENASEKNIIKKEEKSEENNKRKLKLEIGSDVKKGTESKLKLGAIKIRKSTFFKIDMMKIAILCFLCFLGTFAYMFINKQSRPVETFTNFNQKVDFDFQENKSSSKRNNINAKSNNLVIKKLLNELNPTDDPRLYKSIKDLDNTFVTAESKNVKFYDIKKRQMRILDNLVSSNKNDEAYKKAQNINKEVMNRVFEVEGKSVRGNSGRFPSSP